MPNSTFLKVLFSFLLITYTPFVPYILASPDSRPSNTARATHRLQLNAERRFLLNLPYAGTAPTITLSGLSNSNLCAGNTISVAFTISGGTSSTNQFEVWLSDASGSFVNQRLLGKGNASPVSVTLPMGNNAVPYGTGYRLKVISTDPAAESAPSDPLAIGDIGAASILDRNGNSGNGYVCSGSRARLTTWARTSTSTPVATAQYRWSKDGTVLSDQTAASLVTTQPGFYSSTVVQAGCTYVADSYQLIPWDSTFTFYVSPSAYELIRCEGQPVSLSLRSRYAGDDAVYQWKRDGTVISGATSLTYDVTQTGRYTIRMQDGNCAREASSLPYEFGTAIPAAINFNNFADTLACSPSHQTSLFLGGGEPYSAIQWYKNGEAVPGATSKNLVIQGEGTYYAAVQRGNCQTFTHTLTRKIAAQIPVSIQYTGAQKICSDEVRYLEVQTADGPSYQWQRNGVDIPGATFRNYKVSSTGDYSVRVNFGGGCTNTSSARSFTLSETIVPILGSYGDVNTACGDLTLYPLNISYQGYSYQWIKDGTPITGAIGSSLTVKETGLYTVRLTKGSCSGTSKGFYLQTGSLQKPEVSLISSSPIRCANAAVLLQTRSYNNFSLQWKRDGIAIPNATIYQYYATKSGRYVLSLTSGTCTVDSDPVEIKLGEPTSATLAGNALINTGQTTYLPIRFAGAAPWSVTLNTGQSVKGTAQNPYYLPVSPTATTTYAIAAMTNACITGTGTGNAVVTVGSGQADLSLSTVVSNRVPNVGDLVSFSVNISNAGPDNATGVQVQSRLPDGMSFVPNGAPGITHDNGLVSIDAGTIPANSTGTYLFQANVNSPGTLATAAQITKTQTPDPDSQPDSGTDDGQDDAALVAIQTANQSGPLLVSANPNQTPLPPVRGSQPAINPTAVELSLNMALDKPLVSITQQELTTVTLTVRNRGGIPATSVMLRLQLPNGVLSPASQTGWQVVNSQTLNGFISSVPAGGSASLRLQWRPTEAGTLFAQIADVTEVTVESVPGNGYSQGEKDEAQVSVRVK